VIRSREARIVLVAGTVKIPDWPGHHDYLAGCSLLAELLGPTPGLTAAVVRDGWPEDERTLEGADALVFYSGGGRKLPFLAAPKRLELLQRLIDRGVGLVMIHQAVSYPDELAERAAGWLGGVHVAGQSSRGHWRTHHRDFPPHPVTRGVEPWRIRDGWLNRVRFPEADVITPLVWSGPKHRGASSGGLDDVVGWAYERRGGGRSFCFSGLDAHGAWSRPGVRRLIVNGILWSAGLPVPEGGASTAVDAIRLRSYLTPRSRIGWLLRRAGLSQR